MFILFLMKVELKGPESYYIRYSFSLYLSLSLSPSVCVLFLFFCHWDKERYQYLPLRSPLWPMNPSQPENLLSHKPHIITSQNKGRRLQTLHLFTDARILPTPYPLSDFSPKEHLQVERFIFCEIFHLSSARGSRLPGSGQIQEGSLSFLHRQGHTAPKWLL